MNWYIVQSYSGFEKKVVESIKEELKKHKLSDNLNKAMGSSAEIDRYKNVFGVGQQKSFDIFV